MRGAFQFVAEYFHGLVPCGICFWQCFNVARSTTIIVVWPLWATVEWEHMYSVCVRKGGFPKMAAELS